MNELRRPSDFHNVQKTLKRRPNNVLSQQGFIKTI